jgi:bifunctional non-homologous end joining protein LigD
VAKASEAEILTVDGPNGTIDVRISSPSKAYFSREVHLTKLDIARYFLSVAPGALQGIRNRPIVLKRFVDGAEHEPFYQKRAPSDLPAYLRTVTLSFPSGRTAEEVVVDNTPGLLYVVNLGCMELHPHPVLASDLDHPNELRVDLDPGPGVVWQDVRDVALISKAVLEEHGLTPFVKTSGSRGIHINCRIDPRWSFTEVRRAALALAREVERRAPNQASSKWWKEERHGVFLDYNQNAKDRTTASAYSVRPLPDARVSAPLNWDEILTCDPADFTVFTMPARFAAIGDPHADMDAHTGSLEALLDLAARDEASGLGDAPWPPHFAKGEGEGTRVAPSRAKKSAAAKPFSDQLGEGFGEKRFRKRTTKPEPDEPSTAEPNADRSKLKDPLLGTSSDPLLGTGFDASSVTGSDPLLGTGFDASSVTGSDPLLGTGFSPSVSDSQEHGASAPEGDSAPLKKPRATRTPKHPLLTISQSPDKAAAEAGLDRWRTAHPEAAAHLTPDDILTDRMRGSAYIWYRIRVNLRHIPEDLRPTQQTPDPDDDPTRAWRETT